MSLFLTYRLWYGEQPYEPIREDIYEQVFFEEPRLLTGVISPVRILALAGDGVYQLRKGDRYYETAWQMVSLTLQEQSRYEYRAVEAVAGRAPCLRIFFNPFIPVGSGTPWLKDDRYRELEELVLWCLEGEVWAALEEPGDAAETLLYLPGGQADLIEELLEELAAGVEPAYRQLKAEDLPPELSAQLVIQGELYVPRAAQIMEAIYLKAENLDRERLLKTFFVNRSLVRLIHERDGTLIYTDGERGLRIGEGLEYWDPRQERYRTTLSFLSALSVAGRFICNYGGWPEGLRLESLSLALAAPRNLPLRSYRAEWRLYHEGYPVIAGEKAAVVTLNDGGVLYYQRLIYFPLGPTGEEQEAAPAERALEAALLQFKRQAGDSPVDQAIRLETMELAYAVTGPWFNPQAVPAWSVGLGGKKFLLHAGSLEPIQPAEAGL